MDYQYMVYIWMLFFSAVITAFLGGIVFFWRRETREAIFFTLSMLVLTLWSLTNAFEIMAIRLPAKLFWANVQYIAYCYSPVTLVGLCMEFTGYNKLIRNRKFAWFAVLPTIIIILVWTNPYHGLIRYDVGMEYNELFPVITKKYGAAFYIHAVYSHLLNITAVIILIKSVFEKSLAYRRKAIILMMGASLIIVPNVMYVLGFRPMSMDITPIFFGPAGIIVVWAIFRYKLFELIPLARAKAIETMDIGIMVLDLEDKVQDINPALVKLVKPPLGKYLDYRVEEVCNTIPEFLYALKEAKDSNIEFTIHNNGESSIYEVLLTPLINKKGKIIARMVMVYEVTEKKRAHQEFMKQQWTLAGIKEKERLARDLHDNLGQLLGFINMQTQGINQELENNGIDIVSDKLDKLTQVTQMAHAELRGYISDIRRTVESAKDFIHTFIEHIRLFEEQTGIKVDLDYPQDLAGEDLNPSIWMNILNIMKEALSNIRKHAKAQGVKITLHQDDKQLYVLVKDDGRGISHSFENKQAQKGFGLDIMRERAELIGGEIRIKSEMGKGTEIFLQVPLTEGRSHDANETYAGR